MRPIAFLLLAAVSLFAQRPRYGGTLIVETAASFAELDAAAMPQHIGALIAEGSGTFRVAEFVPGRQLVLAANEEHADGRPFLDTVEVRLGRPAAEQLRDFELERAHVIELLPAEVRRQQQRGRRVWSSPPFQLISLVWDRGRPVAQNAAVRESLALAIDRDPMLHVLLQRQGEATGALLPQWLTGYAFLFPTARDLPRARQLAASPPPIALDCDPSMRQVADRIVLNARDTGLVVRVVTAAPADVSLVRLPIQSTDPGTAIEALSRSLGAPSPRTGSLEDVLQSERSSLNGYWIVPLFHIPTLLGIAPEVRDTTPPHSLRWQPENAWLEPVAQVLPATPALNGGRKP